MDARKAVANNLGSLLLGNIELAEEVTWLRGEVGRLKAENEALTKAPRPTLVSGAPQEDNTASDLMTARQAG